MRAPLIKRREPPLFQSLDYTPITNAFSESEQQARYDGRKRMFGYSGRTFVRWCLTLLLGVLMGTIAYGVAKSTAMLNTLRSQRINAAFRDGADPPLIFGALALWNLMLALLSCILVVFVSEAAGASGIPEVKAYLNGVRVPHILELRCVFAKVLGTVAAVSSGLFIGPEGPLVHIGAIIGFQLTRLDRIATCWPRVRKRLEMFRSDIERRDFISIGAASGFAAAFGAPVGGILFAMEEVSSFWSTKLLWRALSATAIATLVLSLCTSTEFNESRGDFGLISFVTQYSSGSAPQNKSLMELIPFALMGALGGILGALCNWCWRILGSVAILRPARPMKQNWQHHFVAVTALSILTSCASFWLPYAMPGVCSDANGPTFRDYVACAGNSSYVTLQFNCAHGERNELATFFFGDRECVIKQLLAETTAEKDAHFANPRTLAIVSVIYPLLMVLAFGAAFPAGIFMPTILAGCCGGSLLGQGLQVALGGTAEKLPSAGAFALIGAVALLGGIQRSSVSLVVIILEGTGEVQFVLPIILTTVCARFVGNLFNEGVYEMAMEQKNIPFLEPPTLKTFVGKTVADVMSRAELKTVTPRPTLRQVLKLQDECEHCGFPVVNEAGQLLGLVLRDQLMSAIELQRFDFARIQCADLESSLGGSSSSSGLNVSSDATPGKVLYAYSSHRKNGSFRHNRLPSWFNREMLVPREHTWAWTSAEDFTEDLEALRREARTAGTAESDEGCDGDRERKEEHGVSARLDHEIPVEDIMTRSVHVVHNTAPLVHAFAMFCRLGLRHLVVLDHSGRVVGIVTRTDLLRARYGDSTLQLSPPALVSAPKAGSKTAADA